MGASWDAATSLIFSDRHKVLHLSNWPFTEHLLCVRHHAGSGEHRHSSYTERALSLVRVSDVEKKNGKRMRAAI